MQNLPKRTLIGVLVVILAVGAGGWGWRSWHTVRLSFRAASGKRGDVTATISASGTIEPVEVVDVGAQVAGLIKAFGMDSEGRTIDYGSVVEEGAMLAKIDESVY